MPRPSKSNPCLDRGTLDRGQEPHVLWKILAFNFISGVLVVLHYEGLSFFFWFIAVMHGQWYVMSSLGWAQQLIFVSVKNLAVCQAMFLGIKNMVARYNGDPEYGRVLTQTTEGKKIIEDTAKKLVKDQLKLEGKGSLVDKPDREYYYKLGQFLSQVEMQNRDYDEQAYGWMVLVFQIMTVHLACTILALCWKPKLKQPWEGKEYDIDTAAQGQGEKTGAASKGATWARWRSLAQVGPDPLDSMNSGPLPIKGGSKSQTPPARGQWIGTTQPGIPGSNTPPALRGAGQLRPPAFIAGADAARAGAGGGRAGPGRTVPIGIRTNKK